MSHIPGPTVPATFEDSTGTVARLTGEIAFTDLFPTSMDSVGGTVVQVGADGDGNSTLGFYGGGLVTKPIIDNATAPALLAALVALGLVTDNT